MAAIPFIVPAAPMPLPLMAAGCYGICYDIFSRATEDDLPNGWNSYRGNTYRQMIDRLHAAGFFRDQYSDFVHPLITPDAAWVAMVSLCLINPPGKLESTVRRLKMYNIGHNVCVVTQEIQPGGIYTQALRGPTPRNLLTPAAAAAMNPAPEIMAVAPPRPHYTRPSAAAAFAGNWVE